MQLLQWGSQHQLANLHLSSHRTTPEHQMTRVMQPFQCDLQPEISKHPITTHTQAHPKQLQATVTLREKKRQTDRSRIRRTHEVPFIVACSHFTRKKHKVSCSGFLPNSPLAFVTASLPHHFPSSPPRFVTSSLPHHFPSSPNPIVTTSLRPLPFLTTSLPHHFPSSPLPFVTTSLPHHFPSSPLPYLTTSLRHHFPSSPLPFVTTSLRHHFPSSPLPFVTTSHRHHFPSSPPPFITTLCHSFLILCDVPPFIKVNSIDSYSFVRYCYVMYCYVMYHPSKRSIP